MAPTVALLWRAHTTTQLLSSSGSLRACGSFLVRTITAPSGVGAVRWGARGLCAIVVCACIPTHRGPQLWCALVGWLVGWGGWGV